MSMTRAEFDALHAAGPTRCTPWSSSRRRSSRRWRHAWRSWRPGWARIARTATGRRRATGRARRPGASGSAAASAPAGSRGIAGTPWRWPPPPTRWWAPPGGVPSAARRWPASPRGGGAAAGGGPAAAGAGWSRSTRPRQSAARAAGGRRPRRSRTASPGRCSTGRGCGRSQCIWESTSSCPTGGHASCCADLFGARLSPGTLVHWVRQGAATLPAGGGRIKAALPGAGAPQRRDRRAARGGPRGRMSPAPRD